MKRMPPIQRHEMIDLEEERAMRYAEREEKLAEPLPPICPKCKLFVGRQNRLGCRCEEMP